MVTFVGSELTKSVHAALREAAVMSYGSMVLPYNSSVEWPSKNASRAPPLLQWPLSSENFQAEVVAQYAALSSGDIRELVAGTGVGKTTVMPYTITNAQKVNGLILFPYDLYSARIQRYLKRKFEQLGGEVRVAEMRSHLFSDPPAAPCVFLSSASTFLGRLAGRPTLLDDLSIDFIYLDESHERVPAYTFFKYLVTARIIHGPKIFYGTATAAGDLNMESARRTVVKVNTGLLGVASPTLVGPGSPLHYSRITCRTLVVLASDSDITAWKEYYHNYDIPAFSMRMCDGTREDPALDRFLDEYPLCVALVHERYRTSVTLNIDAVIDCGYVQRFVTNFSEGSATLVKKPVTRELQIQTQGRVGRYKTGKAYYGDVTCSPSETGMDPDSAFYVYLWSVVFSLRINDPAIADFHNVTGDISRLAAAILLTSRIPPVLLLGYVGNAGFYKPWHKVGPSICFDPAVARYIDESIPTTIAGWSQQNTGVMPYVSSPYIYKSPVIFPKTWQAIPVTAWAHYQEESAAFDDMDARSVITAAETVRPNRRARESVISLPNPVVSEPISSQSSFNFGSTSTLPVRTSRGTSRSSLTAVVEDVRSSLMPVRTPHVGVSTNVELVPRNVTPRQLPSPAVRDESTAHRRAPSERTVELWRNDVPQGITRVNSESSEDRVNMTLRQVNPVKYKRHKLFPMDPVLFDRLVQKQESSVADHRRVDRLLKGSKNLTSFKGDAERVADRQSDYFLSTLRVHNKNVVQLAQLAANVVEPSFLGRMRGSGRSGIDSVEITITETAKLLIAFECESWYVGIDSRTMRGIDAFSSSDTESTVTSLDVDVHGGRALVMLAMGPQCVVDTVQTLMTMSAPYRVDGKFISNAWVYDGCVVASAHVYIQHGVMHQDATEVLILDEEADVVVFNTGGVRTWFRTREPVGVEDVYVLSYDVQERDLVVLGVFSLRVVGPISYITVRLPKGASGSVVVSVADGAVLGLYTTYFGHVDGVELSYVSPISNVLLKLL